MSTALALTCGVPGTDQVPKAICKVWEPEGCSVLADEGLDTPPPHLPEFLAPLSCPQSVQGTQSAGKEAAGRDARPDLWLGTTGLSTDSSIVISRVRKQVLSAVLRGSHSCESARSRPGRERRKACLPPA